MVRILFSSTLLFHAAICLVGLTALSGCSNDDDATRSSSTTATASLGLVQNATVNFYRADGSTLIGSGDTGASGSVTVPATGYTGPVIIEVLGDADASYFDESAGSAIAFGAGQKLRAVVAAPGGAVAVTPLTELAYQAAAHAGQIPISATQANAANEAVRAALAPGLSSILSVPTPFDASTASGSLTDTEAGRYALILAALAELASGDASPALTVLQALVADLVDGQIDGQANGSSVSAPYSNFISDMETALNSMASSYGNAALQASAASQKPASTRVQTTQGGGGDGPNGVTRAATVHASLQAQYTLKVASSQTGSPYTDGETYLVIVGSDNSLTIGDGPALTDPFERQIGNSFNTAEVIWLDESNQLEYALSNNSTGVFNEINIGDAANPQAANGIPGFLGQLTVASSSADPEVGNTGKSKLSGNGFTGVIDGTEYTFADTIFLAPNNSGDGVLRIDATHPDTNLTRWRLFVPGTPGTYECPDSVDDTVLQFLGGGANSGGGNGDGSCTIKLTRNDSGIIEGYFTGTFEPAKAVTDGYFYLDTNPPASTGSVPAGESGMSYTVGGTQFLAQPGAVLANTPNFDYVTLNVGPGAPQTQFFRFPNQTGTYQCGQGPSFRNFYVLFVHQGTTYRGAGANTTEPAGSSCTFTVTQVGTMQSSGGNYAGNVEATFSGTFIADGGATLTVTDGFVRAFGNQ